MSKQMDGWAWRRNGVRRLSDEADECGMRKSSISHHPTTAERDDRRDEGTLLLQG